MASNENISSDEREVKKLRSSEPDLKVVLGSGDTETIHWYHSQTLASKSKYIDTMLSVPMKERDEFVISFPDIEHAIWLKMMMLLDNPVAARQMTAHDALDVAPLYDKYEFVEGKNLCSFVIVDYFKTIPSMEAKYDQFDLDFIIDLVMVTHSANMDDAFEISIKYIWAKLSSFKLPYGRLMFTEEQLEKLVPVLKYSKNKYGPEISEDFTCRHSHDGIKIDMQNFPKKFISTCQDWVQWDLLRRCISHVELSGSTCNGDGDYFKEMGCWDVYNTTRWDDDRRERTATWAGRRVTFAVRFIHEPEGEDRFVGWSIVRFPPTQLDENGDQEIDEEVVYTKCWIAPNSTNLRYPPLKGWIPCDPLARGNPTIKYILNDEIGGSEPWI